MKAIFAALKEVLFSRNPARCMLESMMKWDFKVGDPKQSLMQLCFSNLAAWPVYVVAFLLALDPYRHMFLISGFLGDESRFVHTLLDGHTRNLILFFTIFYALEWLLRIEFFLVAIVLYFLNKGELHINLAVASVFAIYLARICYLWWLAVDCESEAKKVWNRVGLVSFSSWIIVFAATLYALDFILINRLFDGIFAARLFFVSLSMGAFHLLSHVLLSSWGHFYFRAKADPSELRTSYSTSSWILRFGMSARLQHTLRKLIEQQLPKHQKSLEQYAELKGQSPGIAKLSFESVLKKEIEFLKEALLRLNRI